MSDLLSSCRAHLENEKRVLGAVSSTAVTCVGTMASIGSRGGKTRAETGLPMNADVAITKANTRSQTSYALMLPDELWIRIIHIYAEQSNKILPPVRISLVCSRFRSITTGYPPFWTTIGSYYHVDLINACMQRSCGLLIYALFEEVYDDEPKCYTTPDKCIIALMERYDRWATLELRINCDIERISQFLYPLITLMDLPNLRELIIKPDGFQYSSIPAVIRSMALWNTPMMQKLEIAYFIPPLRPQCLTNVTHLEFHSCRSPQDFWLFTKFLTHCPSLSNLELYCFPGLVWTENSTAEKVVLPSLKSLALHTSSYMQTTSYILRVFDMPNLHRYCTSFTYRSPDDILGWLETLFPPHLSYHSIKVVELDIYREKAWGQALNFLPERLQHLDLLSITAEDFIELFPSAFSYKSRPFSTKRLIVSGSRICAGNLQSSVGPLVKDGSLEMICMENGSAANLRYLRNAFPNVRITGDPIEAQCS